MDGSSKKKLGIYVYISVLTSKLLALCNIFPFDYTEYLYCRPNPFLPYVRQSVYPSVPRLLFFFALFLANIRDFYIKRLSSTLLYTSFASAYIHHAVLLFSLIVFFYGYNRIFSRSRYIQSLYH